MRDDVSFIFDDPLDDLAFLKLHRLRNGRGEVDVIWVGSLLAGDELNFSCVPQNEKCGGRLKSSVYTQLKT